jgi:cell wall-associated NlpC family hydrolase
MKRINALVLGLVSVATMVAVTVGAGTANADPATRPAGHQQAVDAVIARAMAQRGVPYTYGGGNAAGPSQRPASVPAPDAVVPDSATTGFGLTPTPLSPSYPLSDQSANVVGFDASGLMVYAYAGVGLKLPRTSGDQYKVGWKVTPDQALPGDLIFYGPDGTTSVAMYLGNGQMLEATNPVVKVSPVRANGMAPYLSRIIS